MRILIADPSAVVRELTIRTLLASTARRLEFAEANDGVELLAKATDFAPDIIFCKWNLPKMHGIEALQRLRCRGDEAPFCFLASESTSEMRCRAEAAGAIGFLVYPIAVEDLQAALGILLDSRRLATSSFAFTPHGFGSLHRRNRVCLVSRLIGSSAIQLRDPRARPIDDDLVTHAHLDVRRRRRQ